MPADKWTTNDEIAYLRAQHLLSGATAIRKYATAMHLRVNWAGLDENLIKAEVYRLLSSSCKMFVSVRHNQIRGTHTPP